MTLVLNDAFLRAWDHLDSTIQRILTSTLDDISPRALRLDQQRQEFRSLVHSAAAGKPEPLERTVIEALEHYATALEGEASRAMAFRASRDVVDELDDKVHRVKTLLEKYRARIA